MLAFSFGPFAISANVLSLMIAVLVAAAVGHWVGRMHKASVVGTLGDMLLAAIVAARGVFVVLWFDRYVMSPWHLLDLRDGGFTTWAGVVSAALVGGWRAWKRPELRKPLAIGLLAGACSWMLTPGGFQFGNGRALAALDAKGVTDLAATPRALTALAAGRPTVVNLWASWCPPCLREMPALAAARVAHPEVRFVFANQGEDATTVRAFLAREELPDAGVVLDRRQSLGRSSGSVGLPTTLFYDARGRLVSAHMGALSEASLAARLAELAPAR